MNIEELDELAKRHQRGEVSEEELANTVRTISASISFESAVKTFELLYGPPTPTSRLARVSLASIDATQPCLQFAKLHLVKWLFTRPEDYDRLNAMYFPKHPISLLRLGNARFAVIDGHHRLWQAGALFGLDGQVAVQVVSTRNTELLTTYRGEVRMVKELNGSSLLRYLPIRDRPDSSAVLRLTEMIDTTRSKTKAPKWLPPELEHNHNPLSRPKPPAADTDQTN